jgi:hypothetical protein
MKQYLEKLIASIVALSLILSLCFEIFLLKPKMAEATDGGGAIMNAVKEYALDAISSTIRDVMMERLKTNIYDWGMGKKSDINLPFTIEDFQDYLDDAINRATGKFIEDMRLTNLCSPIALSFGERFKATFTVQYNDRPQEKDYVGCSLNTVINNIEAFIKRPRITLFGWDAWRALKTPNNNIFGSFFLAQDIKIKALRNAKTNAEKKAAINQGYKDETTTAATNKEDCTGNCTNEYEKCLASGPGTGTSNFSSGFSLAMGADARNYFTLAPTQVDALGLSRNGVCSSTRNSCLQTCENQPEIATKFSIKNAGQFIAEEMRKGLGIEADKLGFVDEITELVGVFFQALINKAMFTGLSALSAATQQARAAERTKLTNKENYSYLRSFSKTNTTSKKKDVRASVLAGMDKSIKQLARSIINCGEKEMMGIEEYAKNLNNLLESNVEGLYVGLQGINLKSDAVILDPPYAPYSVYGYSWGEVFPSKVPDKCRAILNQMNLSTATNCTDIISGLEPIYGQQAGGTMSQCNDDTDNDGDGLIDYPADPGCSSITDNGEANTGGGGGGGEPPEERERVPQVLDIIPGFGENTCLPCIYDHDVLNCPPGPTPPQRYPGTSFLGIGASTVWTTAILQQKQTHYDSCRQWYDVALDRCDECMKKYNSKCSRLRTDEEKTNCIMVQCGGPTDNPDALFEDFAPNVIDPPTSGLDFYNKCEVEAQKDACFTCLAEYFVPATYCEQSKDYVARLVIKYPSVVKYVRTGDNKGQFLGLFDQTISDMGGECNDNWDKKNISLALICRILPEFSFKGEKVCRTRCLNRAGGTLTQAQLTNITDFRPDENDCGNVKLDVGGKEPFDALDNGILESRGICCADFWQKDRKKYATCVGAGPTTEEPDTEPNPANLSCTLSANPASGPAPLNNVDLTINATGLVSGNAMSYNFDCNNDGTFERVINNTATGTTFNTTVSDICNYTVNNTAYTASATIMNEVGNSATCTINVQTTDCEITATLNPANGIVPVTTSITGRLNNSETGPFTFQFYCDVPPNGGPITGWSGATIEYVSDINQYTLADACNFTSPGTETVGVSIARGTTTSSCYQTISISDAPAIACGAEILSGMVFVNDPIDIFVDAMPNSSYTSLIHNSVGTVLSYNCDGYNVAQQTIPSTTSLGVHESTLHCNFNTPGTYPITVTIGNTNPANGFSASGTCQTTVFVENSGGGGEYLP